MTNVDKYWALLFDKFHVLDEIQSKGDFVITADQIKSIDNEEIHAEPRLLTKFDRKETLPEIFRQNKLSILPITRGSYLISHIDTHHKFEKFNDDNSKLTFFQFPDHILSIDPDNISSESIALNCAYITGILEDFIEDEDIKPTVNGRMGSKSFDFNIKDSLTNALHKIKVSNSQIEIDAAYEGVNYLSIIEAKCNISEDFLVRQLYYPYRLWSSKIDKDIKIIFMVYSNHIFTLYEYEFANPTEYTSLRLTKQKRYSIENLDISMEDIHRVFNSIAQCKLEPVGIPFPQADNFERIINICELLRNESSNYSAITEYNLFTGRQTSYYISACKYLGLVGQDGKGKYRLTDEGRRIIESSQKEKQLLFAEKILSFTAFHKVMKECLNKGKMPPNQEIISIMQNSDLNISNKTTPRRSQTIKSWIKWILNLVNS